MDDFDDMDELPELPEPQEQSQGGSKSEVVDPDDTPEAMFADGTLQVASTTKFVRRPWFDYHKFVLVESADQVVKIVDQALAAGRCALDLETEGFDNRINYDEGGNPSTPHKIVGYCLCVDGVTGYYVPVRHRPDPLTPEINPNVDDVKMVDAQIKRLCRAAQPPIDPEAAKEDPLGGKAAEPPQVVIEFWNAKFDQEFLYPITGIDYWHPDSFEDGLLACFTIYSGDKAQGLKPKAKQYLRTPKGDPYLMIELKELFQPRQKPDFAGLDPKNPGVKEYAAGDSICTALLCRHPEIEKAWKDKKYAAAYRIEKKVCQVSRVMDRNRVMIDRAEVAALIEEAKRELAEVEKKIVDVAASVGFKNFNPGSPQQVSDLLFTEAGFNLEPKPPLTEQAKKSGTKQYSTSAKVLEELAEAEDAPEILVDIVKFRQIDKIIGTYLEGMLNDMDEHDQLRFDFKQTGTVTGRFSAPSGKEGHGGTRIPIHGIPARKDPKRPKVAHSLRRMFISRPGYTMVKSDYAGQELRIVTNLSKEPVWLKEFLEGTGDLHTITAQAFFGDHINKDSPERKMGKCVHPSTLVFSEDGLLPIQELGPFPNPETFGDPDREIRLQGKPVSALYNGGEKPLVHVVISGGIVTCTQTHFFLLRDGRFVSAKDLKSGDKLHEVEVPLLGSKPYERTRLSLWEGIPQSEYALHHDLAYFAGAYIGDGTGNQSSVRLIHGAVDKLDHYGNPFEDWVRVLEDACGRCGFTTSRKKDHTLYLGSRVFARFLSRLGIQKKRAKNLRVPSWVLRAGRESILHFLGGLFDTDGTVGDGNHNLDWTTKDFVLAGQVGCALRACGLDFNVELTFNKTYQRHYVRLRLTVGSSWEMRPFMRHAGKLSRLRAPQQHARTKDRFEVLQVLDAGQQRCLDITVDDAEHRYLANGFMTHNTANFALVYGGGPAAIMRATGCNKQEARRRKQNFDKKVSKFASWVSGQHAFVKKNLGVYTASGRWIAIPDANCKEGQKDSMGRFLDKEEANKLRAACERHSTNYPIQGCLQPSARILTDRGYLTIAELSWQKDCRVWTGTNWAPFKLCDMGPWQYAEIELADGTLIPCDTRHKVLVFAEHGYIWKEFSDLCVGDMVATSIPKPVIFPALPLPDLVLGEHSTHTPVMPPDSEDDLWFWLGYYFGDGWKGEDGLHYFFGAHETAKMDQCVGFWRRWGLNPIIRENTHQPHEKVSTRYAVDIYSVDLVRWLDKLGIPAATAHTKRLSTRIFSESMVNRQRFMLGLMASDGHHTTNGDPYSIHLCQEQLLRDVKLLLRTLGVDSTLYGPYTYKGNVSYRLDINQRMFRSAVEHTSARLPKMVDLYAPSFLVDELLERYPKARQRDFPTKSLYNLYLRMRSGGTVTLITFQHMLDVMGWEISQPVYGYQRVKELRELPTEGPTYTLSVQDEGHRFEAEGVINKNTGADILKISLILLHREFHKRGWLRDGQDCVRILLTVHDEIVFEARDDMVPEVMEVIEYYMEEYGRMVQWQVPLIVEPLLGKSWAATYDWRCMKYGEPYEEGQPVKDHQYVEGGRIYSKIPDWLEGILSFDHGKLQSRQESPKPSAQLPKRKDPPKVVVFRINKLDEVSVKSVCVALMNARFSHGPTSTLHLMDSMGNTLIPPTFRGKGIQIDPETFGHWIREQNLGPGVPGLPGDE